MSEVNVVGRRRFLAGLAGLFAAPAIVRAESLMKLWVPSQELTLAGRGMTTSIIQVDESGFLECMSSPSVLAFRFGQGIAMSGCDYDGDAVDVNYYNNGGVFISRYPALNLSDGQLFHKVNGKLVPVPKTVKAPIAQDGINRTRRMISGGRG